MKSCSILKNKRVVDEALKHVPKDVYEYFLEINNGRDHRFRSDGTLSYAAFTKTDRDVVIGRIIAEASGMSEYGIDFIPSNSEIMSREDVYEAVKDIHDNVISILSTAIDYKDKFDYVSYNEANRYGIRDLIDKASEVFPKHRRYFEILEKTAKNKDILKWYLYSVASMEYIAPYIDFMYKKDLANYFEHAMISSASLRYLGRDGAMISLRGDRLKVFSFATNKRDMYDIKPGVSLLAIEGTSNRELYEVRYARSSSFSSSGIPLYSVLYRNASYKNDIGVLKDSPYDTLENMSPKEIFKSIRDMKDTIYHDEDILKLLEAFYDTYKVIASGVDIHVHTTKQFSSSGLTERLMMSLYLMHDKKKADILTEYVKLLDRDDFDIIMDTDLSKYSKDIEVQKFANVSSEYITRVISILSNKLGVPFRIVNEDSADYKGYVDYSYGGPVVVINAATATHDTPIHEYAHILVRLIRLQNKRLYSSLLKELFSTEEGKKLVDEIAKNNTELSYEDAVEEAIVELIGRYGAGMLDKNTGTLLDTAKNIARRILEFISKIFNIKIYDVPFNTNMAELAALLLYNEGHIDTKGVYEEDIKHIRDTILSELSSLLDKISVYKGKDYIVSKRGGLRLFVLDNNGSQIKELGAYGMHILNGFDEDKSIDEAIKTIKNMENKAKNSIHYLLSNSIGREVSVNIGEDRYIVKIYVRKNRSDTVEVVFKHDEYNMSDLNRNMFFKILPRVIDAVSVMTSDLGIKCIYFNPVRSDKTDKGRNLRLIGYNIFARRLFGSFSELGENDNRTLIPVPEIFRNREVTNRVYQKSNLEVAGNSIGNIFVRDDNGKHYMYANGEIYDIPDGVKIPVDSWINYKTVEEFNKRKVKIHEYKKTVLSVKNVGLTLVHTDSANEVYAISRRGDGNSYSFSIPNIEYNGELLDMDFDTVPYDNYGINGKFVVKKLDKETDKLC